MESYDYIVAETEDPETGGRKSGPDPLAIYIRQTVERVKKKDLLTPEQEIKLAKQIAQGDETAFDTLVEANLRLVATIARRCHRYTKSLSINDLIQEGNIGLVIAARKFDWRQGWRFSTYASYWIRQAIMRAIETTGRQIRLPAHTVGELVKVNQVSDALHQKNGRRPTPREIGCELGFKPEKVSEILSHHEPLSLESPYGDEDDLILGETVADPGPPPWEKVEANDLRATVLGSISTCLNTREEQVIRLRFGFDNDGDPMTLDQVSREFQLTRERIRQIEVLALRKLKAYFNKRRELDVQVGRSKRRPRRRLNK